MINSLCVSVTSIGGISFMFEGEFIGDLETPERHWF